MPVSSPQCRRPRRVAKGRWAQEAGLRARRRALTGVFNLPERRYTVRMAGRWTRLRRFTRFSLRTFVLLLLLLGAAGALWRQWEPWVEVAVLGGDLKGAVEAEFSADGNRFLSIFDMGNKGEQTVRVYDGQTYAKICDFSWPNKSPDSTFIQFINNTWVFISLLGQNGFIVELSSGRIVSKIENEEVVPINGSSIVLLKKHGGNYRFLDLRSRSLRATILHPECHACQTVVSKDGKNLFTLEPYSEGKGGSEKLGKVIIWDTTTSKQVGVIEIPGGGITQLRMDDEGVRLAIEYCKRSERETYVALWDVDRSRIISECSGKLGMAVWNGFLFNSPWYLVDVNPTSTELRSKWDGSCRLPKGLIPNSFVDLSLDNRYLVSTERKDLYPINPHQLVLWPIQVWDLQRNELHPQFLLSLGRESGQPRADFGSSPEYLLLVHRDGKQILRVSNTKPSLVFRADSSFDLVLLGGIRAVQWKHTSKELVVIRLDSPELITTISAHTEFKCLDCALDGERFVTGHADGTARVWERRRDEGTVGLFALPSLWLTALFFAAFFWSAIRDVKELKSA